jgi:hypothetical protein
MSVLDIYFAGYTYARKRPVARSSYQRHSRAEESKKLAPVMATAESTLCNKESFGVHVSTSILEKNSTDWPRAYSSFPSTLRGVEITSDSADVV